MHRNLVKNVITAVAVYTIIIQSLTPLLALAPKSFAQEVTPTDSPTPTVTATSLPTDSPTPTPVVSPTPTDTPLPTDTVTPSPTPLPTDTVTPTPTPVDNLSPPPGDNGSNSNSNSSDNNQVQGASVSPSPTPTVFLAPTPIPTPDPATGNEQLSLVILKNTAAPAIDISATVAQGSAVLTTDKQDYAPTDTVLITGSNLLPNTDYILSISSQDQPPIGVNVQVKSDGKGEFAYAYQLDGNYRPNYKAELKDLTGTVVASTTFTDSRTINSATLNGQTNAVVPIGGVTVSAAVTVSHTGSGTSNDWKSTGWRIGTSGLFSCVDHGDYTSSGTDTETFNITAPSAAGTYDVNFEAYNNDGCSSGASSTFGANQIIVVSNPSWPSSWTTPVSCSADPSGDESPNSADLVGDVSNPAVGYATDSNYRYFRERVAGDPAGSGGFDQYAWVVLFQTGIAPSPYQYLGSVNGKDELVQLWQNTSTAGNLDFSPLLNDPAETKLWEGPGGTFARIVNAGGGFYYVDWALPKAALPGAIADGTTKFFATSANENNFNKDHLNCYETAKPDLTVTKTNNVNGSVNLGSNFTWTITVTNNGLASATFNNQNILLDNLPTNATYSNIQVSNAGGTTGTVDCTISSSNLDCDDNSGGSSVVIPAGGSFTVSFTVTPTSSTTLANPRSGGACGADPNSVISESNENNNLCSNSVTVNTPDLTAVKTNDVNGTTVVNSAFTWKIHVANGGTAPASYSNGNTIVSDHLPSSGATYSSPTASAISGGSGTINCSINGSFNLTCIASGAVTINAGGSFDVTWTTTPTVTGTLDNPRDGTCSVSSVTGESNTNNNSCSNSVTVTRYVAPNPGLPQSCGLDIALVIDNSDSISTSELNQMKSAMNGFVTALNGTPTEYSVTRFATTATVVQNFPGATVSTAINGIPQGGGFTNWQDGLTKAQSTLTNRGDHPDLVIFASDGNPNRTGTSGTSVTESVAVDNAVLVANALKTNGARIIALGIGVGAGLGLDNLKAISGPTVGTTVSSDVITSDFSSLATDLETYAKAICGGTITVNKQVDSNGDGHYEGGNTEANNLGFKWGLDNGSANRNMGTNEANVVAGDHTVTENTVSGYTFKGWYASNDTQHSCTNPTGTTLPVNVTTSNNVITAITLCNQVSNGTIIVHKDVLNPDGGAVTDTTATFKVKLDGANEQPIIDGGTVTYSNVSAGNHTVTESVVPSDYTLYGISTVAGQVGTPAGLSVNVAGGQTIDVYVTNKQKKASITVVKVVKDAKGQDVNDHQTFTVQLNGVNDDSTLANNHNVVYNVNPGGPFTVSEVSNNNYDNLGCKLPTGADASGISLTSNQTITVTCTNQQKPGTISGYKFRANGSTPIANWGISLFKCTAGDFLSCVLSASTFTNGSGFFSFTDLITGFYKVVEDLVSSYTPVGVTYHNVTINPATVSEGNNFSNFKNFSISGEKYNDLNGNGQLDSGEPGIENWTINLYKYDVNGNPIFVTSTTTDANGDFSFTNLGPAPYNYKLAEENQSDWTQTEPADFYNVAAQDGQDIVGYRFGNFHKVSVTACKKQDIDGNIDTTGDQSFVAGWHVNLMVNGQPTSPQVTGDNGCYTWSNLGPGNYGVGEAAQSGWQNLTPTTHIFGTVLSGSSNTYTFINHPYGSITVHKLVDINGNNSYVSGDDGDFTWNIDGVGTNVMGSTDSNVNVGERLVNESTVSNYHFVGWFPTGAMNSDEVLYSCTNLPKDELNNYTQLPIHVNVGANGTSDFTLCNQRDTGSVKVNKLADTNGDGSFETLNPETFTWTLDDGGTNVMGSTVSDVITGSHDISENTIPGYKFIGWYLGHPTDNQFSCTRLPEYSSTTLPANVNVVKDNTLQVNLCNQLQLPKLTIAKSNDVSGDKIPGDIINFTIKITNDETGGEADNVKVVDLLPKGFHYNSGSWHAALGAVTLPVSEPTYASPGTWTLPNMAPGDNITLTYSATIDSGQQAGTYYDNAWGQGTAVGDSTVILASADPVIGYIGDPNFVGTKVPVVVGSNPGTNYNVISTNTTQSVLGASTGPELPSTGESTLWVIIATLMFGLGAVTLVTGLKLKKKYE